MAACAEKNLTDEEDFDEDVVFENSPLYQHLQDVGQLDFEVGTTTSKCKREAESLTGAPGYQAWFKGVVMSVLGNILGFLLQVGTFPKRVLAEVERGYVKQYVSLLVQSKLLLDDDHHFLQLYDPDTYSGDDTDTNWFLSTDTLKLEQFSTHFGAAVVLAIALFLQQNYWLVVTLLVLPGALCLTGWFALFIRRHHEHKSTVTLLRTWLVEGEKCVTLARKSFRHIQERELVARGFTMVHGQVPLERMIHSRLWQSQQQCASLRATLVRVTSDMIQQHRKAVHQLLQDYPLNSEVDNTNSYISVIPLQELTNQLLNDTSQVEVNDDNSSLKSLKNLVQLQADQVSEFVRRFALGFSPSTHHTSEPTHGQEVISSFRETLQKLGEVSESGAKVLEKQYDFQTKYGVAKEQEKMLRPENSPLVGLHTAIHSLGLHLQVTMSRVNSIEGSICAAMDVPQQDWTELQQEVMQQLQEVETQLQACKECWEEGSRQLHNLDDNTTDAARSHVDSDSESEKPIDSRTVEDVISVLLVSADANDVIGDPLIEEQVFEAYINEEHNTVDGDGYDPLLTPEEREQQKKERAEAKKMVRELKNVLTVRKQERERKNKTGDEEAKETVNNPPNVLSEPTEKTKTEDVVNDGSLRQQLEVPEQDDVLRRYSPVMSDVYGSGRRSKSSSFDEEDTDLTDRVRLVAQDNESHLYNTSEEDGMNHCEVNGGVEVDCIPKLVNGNIEQVARGACNGTDSRNGQNQDDIAVEDRCRKSGYARLSEGSSEEGCVSGQAGLGGYSFQASLAAQAVARSRQLGLGAAMLQEQSFGDEEKFGSDSDDGGD
ncbi:PREDICTED: vezatin-like [Branchiostoma belcheri]|uniref:Vezatin n=1 Tax=Branchiostoma belcheri TaxID=7741 RepID=A0A6P4Z8C9_BRABE|nr:PREDICTED: vezatin-like [Branchiostoma belcheri]